MKRFYVGTLALAVVGLLGQAAMADTITWTQWGANTPGTPGVAVGTISPGNTVTYNGDFFGLQLNYPSWTPTTTYADGTIVTNAPPPAGGIIKLKGGNNNTNTITFSTPVTNPVMAIWSLGQGGNQTSFNFNTPFTIVAGGPSIEYAGQTITSTGNTVYGVEGNGTIQFAGTYSSIGISWTNPVFENWYGFTVGAPTVQGAVPLPAAAGLGFSMLGGFGAVFAFRKRMSRKSRIA